MIKVLVLGTRGFPGVQGGVEKHCEQLCPRLAGLGCEVTVVTRSPYLLPAARTREWRGVRFIHLWAPRSKHLEAFIHTFLGVMAARLRSPDIVHLQAIGPALLTPLAKSLGLRVVVTNHGPDYQRRKWGAFARAVLRCGESLGTRRADRVIAISRAIRSALEEKYGRRDIEYIPNGVERTGAIPPEETLKRFGLEPKKYAFTACRFVPEKGIEDLIEAYGRIPATDFKLVIAGAADHESPCSRRIRELARRNQRVILTGFVSGKPLAELFSNAGLFVLPSHYEGLPIALLEAMSYGLPVLASDLPSTRELPLSASRLFPAGDAAALSRKLAELMGRGLTGEERQRQRRLLDEEYNWDRIAEKTVGVYRSILSQ